jgi:hypothetical protein
MSCSVGVWRKLDSVIKPVPPALNAIPLRACSILQERKLVGLPFLIVRCVRRNEEVIGAKLAVENQQTIRCLEAARCAG